MVCPAKGNQINVCAVRRRRRRYVRRKNAGEVDGRSGEMPNERNIAILFSPSSGDGWQIVDCRVVGFWRAAVSPWRGVVLSRRVRGEHRTS